MAPALSEWPTWFGCACDHGLRHRPEERDGVRADARPEHDLKAHLGELADAAATNPVSQSVMADMAKQKYQALVDIAGTTATVRSGVAAKLGQQIAQSTSSGGSKRYDVASSTSTSGPG